MNTASSPLAAASCFLCGAWPFRRLVDELVSCCFHGILRGAIFLTAVVSKERVTNPHGTFIGRVRFVANPIDTKDLIECIDRELVPPAA